MTVRVIDVLGAFSVAADMALGLSAGHGLRAAYIGMHLAEPLRLPRELHADLFYSELLMDAGCTAWASHLAATILGDENAARNHLFFMCDPRDPRDLIKWLARYMAAGESLPTRVKRSLDFVVHGRAFMAEGLENTSEVAARMARRLGRSPGVQEALRGVFAQWEPPGPRPRRVAPPMVSRIVFATLLIEVLHQIGGRDAALRLARERRGKMLDADVVDAFVGVSGDPAFWRGLEDESIWPIVRAMEPQSEHQYITADQLDDAAAAFADFADLKSFYSTGHSRRVATLAHQMARALQVSDADAITIRRAALLHDVGLVAVPSFVLHKADDRLTDADREAIRLHPYHAERILSYVPAFTPIVPLVAAHHEQPDGGGYFRGLRGDEIPRGACVLAAADRFDDLTHAGPGRPPLDSRAALAQIRAAAGLAFSVEAVQALERVAPERDPDADAAPAAAVQRPKRVWPAGLTDREVDVLRLLAGGANRRAIAGRLSVSEHTIRHHLEHIYSKIDVRTRVEAALFAVEHGLLH